MSNKSEHACRQKKERVGFNVPTAKHLLRQSKTFSFCDVFGDVVMSLSEKY